MEIKKIDSLLLTGYSMGFKMLTNFVFEITDVEYRDNLYGYFTLKIKKNEGAFVTLKDVTICGADEGNFKQKLAEKGSFTFHPDLQHPDLISIFSYEFDQFVNQKTIQS